MITAKEILELKGSKIVYVDRDTSVFSTIEIMVENSIGAVTIKDNGTLAGIWTERDLLRNILKDDFVLKETKIGDCLLGELHTIPDTASLFDIQTNFLGLFTRHLFITHDEEIIGLISCGDVIKTNVNIQKQELDKLKTYVSMEYYENWKWGDKNR